MIEKYDLNQKLTTFNKPFESDNLILYDSLFVETVSRLFH